MDRDNAEDTTTYKVVVNHEEQYSIWPDDRENPRGWRDAGKRGLKQECLDYIDETWTDMRPLSLRMKMEEERRRLVETVQPLTQARHTVVIDWPEATPEQIQDSVERGFIPVAFTEAADLPGIGLFLDQETTDSRQADFRAGTGTLHLVGTGSIYAVGKVRISADIDLATRTGLGQVIVLEPVLPGRSDLVV